MGFYIYTTHCRDSGGFSGNLSNLHAYTGVVNVEISLLYVGRILHKTNVITQAKNPGIKFMTISILICIHKTITSKI